jgi:hypothetical protein
MHRRQPQLLGAAVALRASRRARRVITTVQPSSNGPAAGPGSAAAGRGGGPAWWRAREWALASLELDGGRTKLTDFLPRRGAEVPVVEAVRRIPTRDADGGAEAGGHPARRQAASASQIEALSSGEGSSKDGRPTATLLSR